MNRDAKFSTAGSSLRKDSDFDRWMRMAGWGTLTVRYESVSEMNEEQEPDTPGAETVGSCVARAIF
jgi:hypothetical protein